MEKPPHRPVVCAQTSEEEEVQKPAVSYIELIAKAILAAPLRKLCLQEIYDFIERFHPYFRGTNAGWRNSVRHNLSLHDCFCKGDRCENGKGRYWYINQANMEDFRRGDFRRRLVKARTRHAHELYAKCHPYGLERGVVPCFDTPLLAPQLSFPSPILPLALPCVYYFRPAGILPTPVSSTHSEISTATGAWRFDLSHSPQQGPLTALHTSRESVIAPQVKEKGVLFSVKNILAAE